MPCSSSQYPPSPYDKDTLDYHEIKCELKSRSREIKVISEQILKQEDKRLKLEDRVSALEKEYTKLLDYYQLMGNGS